MAQHGYDIQYLTQLFCDEENFMAAQNYQKQHFSSYTRKRVVTIIDDKCETYQSSDTYLPYLALLYFDRYVSRNPIQDLTNEVLELISISCISLASKMRSSAFQLSDFLGKVEPNLTHKDVMEKELEILSTLNWRLHSTMAFCFLDYFISFLKINNPHAQSAFKSKVEAKWVFKMYRDILFTKFKPSIIAASAVIRSSSGRGLKQLGFREDIRSCSFLDGDELDECMNAMAILK